MAASVESSRADGSKRRQIDGSIDAVGQRLPGGTVHQGSGLFGITDYVSTVADNGAEKGEGGGRLSSTPI